MSDDQAAPNEDFVIDVTEADFEESVLVASTRMPVLIDFWAPWCGPCKQLTPIIEKVVASYQGAVRLCKVNTDEQQQIAAAFGIRSLPTVMLLKDGRPLDGFMGVQSEAVIRALLEKHVGAVPEPVAPAVPADPKARLEHARAAIAREPDEQAHRLPLIAALLENGSPTRPGRSSSACRPTSPIRTSRRRRARSSRSPRCSRAPRRNRSSAPRSRAIPRRCARATSSARACCCRATTRARWRSSSRSCAATASSTTTSGARR
jgi:thioredoxin